VDQEELVVLQEIKARQETQVNQEILVTME
jgi:hypothetical protein